MSEHGELAGLAIVHIDPTRVLCHVLGCCGQDHSVHCCGRPDYRRAAEELAGCLARLHAGGGKTLQAALAADALLAVELCDA
jgi:hypothetical protein